MKLGTLGLSSALSPNSGIDMDGGMSMLGMGMGGEEDDEEEYEWEIFPTGDDLAIAIAEDLWPNALGYFSELPQ